LRPFCDNRENKLIGCAVIRISARFCYGRYCDIDNVIIDTNFRRQGIATKLFDWIHAYGKQQGCEASVLDSYIDNKASHPFYKRAGYLNTCLHFFRELL
jgi:diamine N-acetyltransferase